MDTQAYNDKLMQLLELNKQKKGLAAELSAVTKTFELCRDEVIDLMLENDAKMAEEIGGFRISRTHKVSCSMLKDRREDAIALARSLGMDDAITLQSQRLTSHVKTLFPDAFEGTKVNDDDLPENVKACISVFSKPSLSIRKKA